MNAGNIQAQPSANMSGGGVKVQIEWLVADDQETLLQDENNVNIATEH